MSSMDKMEVSRDTEFVASICSTHSHKHLGLGAGVAAVVKKGDGQPSVQADREGSFGLPRRRGAIYARGCQGHKGGTRGQILSARYARATTLARVCGGGRQGWRRPGCRAPYLPSGLIARAHRASWSTCGVGGRSASYTLPSSHGRRTH